MWKLKNYKKKLEKRFKKQETNRMQLNFTCHVGLIARLKLLSKYLDAPLYPLAEHALELGLSEIYPEAKDDPIMWKACSEFLSWFEKEVVEKEGINCRDITGVDWSNREQAKAFYKGEGVIKCANNTEKTAQILGEILEKYINKD